MAHTGLEYFARCASGFEKVLAQELRDLGLKRIRPLQGGVAFFGSRDDGYRACLWSRVATRIQLVLTRVDARNADALYAGAYGFSWEDHLLRDKTISIRAHGTNQELRKTTFTALKVKDALCDRLRDMWGTRPNVDPKHPDFAVDVALHEQKATLYLNLSGESLHRRGYREDGVQTEAPLKETLAAGMLLTCSWPRVADAAGWLIDPMCGSGTIAIEAALVAANVAPGLLRTRWGFEAWAAHDQAAWEAHLAEAYALRTYAAGQPRILAGDQDDGAISIARANAERAGVDDMIQFFQDDAANLGRHMRAARKMAHTGMLVTNPPYGIRLLAQGDLRATYDALADGVEQLPRGWDVVIITPDPGIDSALGRLPHATTSCFNGPLETTIRQYDTNEVRLVCEVTSLTGKACRVPLASKGSEQFASRLRKVARERMRWARREGISCLRLYDADLPDYPLSIDLYVDVTGHRYAHVEQATRRKGTTAEQRAQRLADAVTLTGAILDIPTCDITVLSASDERETRRHASTQPQQRTIRVEEAGCVFDVDLRRPHVAMPLVQRLVRAYAAQEAPGKRVACLFATGIPTLLTAAHAGAAQTVAVDASSSHLEAWHKTFAQNSLLGKKYRFVVSPPKTWARREAQAHHTYDLIVCIPPTWLPAKDAGGKDWETKRDAPGLLSEAARLLSPAGKMLFVSDDVDERDIRSGLQNGGLAIEDMSTDLLPRDFERLATKPCCLIVRRRR